MLPSNEREVVQFDIRLEIDPPGRLDGIITEISELLINRVTSGQSISLIDNERLQIGISDAKFVRLNGNEKGGLALLFDLADPMASIAAHRHMPSRKVRTFERQDGEGRAVSAHMLMDLTPKASGRYRALLETSIGLGRSRITPHLQRQFKAVFAEGEIQVENADGDLVKAVPKLDMFAVFSDKLKSGMRDAEIAEVVLIQSKIARESFDPPDIATVKRREMRLKINKPPQMSAEEALKAIVPWAKKNEFEQIYVRWRKPSETEENLSAAAGAKYNRAKIDLANQDVGETLFSRRHFVTLDAEMTDCVEKIREDMIGCMATLI